MALQNDGEIKISQIKAEFSLTDPVRLSVARDTASLPTGTVSFSDFYGLASTKITSFSTSFNTSRSTALTTNFLTSRVTTGTTSFLTAITTTFSTSRSTSRVTEFQDSVLSGQGGRSASITSNNQSFTLSDTMFTFGSGSFTRVELSFSYNINGKIVHDRTENPDIGRALYRLKFGSSTLLEVGGKFRSSDDPEDGDEKTFSLSSGNTFNLDPNSIAGKTVRIETFLAGGKGSFLSVNGNSIVTARLYNNRNTVFSTASNTSRSTSKSTSRSTSINTSFNTSRSTQGVTTFLTSRTTQRETSST